MFYVTVALLFLLKLRFPSNKTLNSLILERYDLEGLKSVRYLSKIDLKLRKNASHLNFLLTCQTNNLTPNFLKFKLYSKDVENRQDYSKFQRQLLDKEVEEKRATKFRLEKDLQHALHEIKSFMSWLDFTHVWADIDNTNNKKLQVVKTTQARKL